MEELWSHPNKPLISHLREVAVIASTLMEGKGYCFSLLNDVEITQKQLTDLIWIAGAFHDLGKATSYFQTYIRNPEEAHSHLKNHAQLSSVFAYYVAKKYCSQVIHDSFLAKLIPTLVLTVVKRHHGNIANLTSEMLFDNAQIENLSLQIEHIDSEKIEAIISDLLGDFSAQTTWMEFVEYWNSNTFKSDLSDFCFLNFKLKYHKTSEKHRLRIFYLFQILYSSLLFADKSDVILNEVQADSRSTDIAGCLSRFRERKGFNKAKTEIDQMKNDAYFDTLAQVEKVFSSKQHLYSITLPTGLGKTLLAYAVAAKLRQLSENPTAKIIINIPFTSIIDQNFEVYREVLDAESVQELLKHHHLAEPIYKDKSERVYDFNKSQFLIETWQSETIVTTFVQFLETILSMDKTKLMKLAHLRNSVVLLDEIQTIPYKLWGTIRKSFKTLSETLNMYFVLISATQPLIFAPGEDIVELVPDHQKFFRFFNRTRLHFFQNYVSLESFVEIASNFAFEKPEKDILVILNTKKAALRCFEQFVSLDFNSTDFYLLSTLITPYERKKIITEIKKKNGRRKIVVSTQLIEAGVDISVDTIFRQLSPVDSIIQSAGRANRYNEKEEISDVFLYEIEGEYAKATSRIYGADLILKTKNVLKKYTIVEESNYLQLIQRYFEEVRKQSDETFSDLLEAMYGLQFSEVNLEVIEERHTESVFIQLNEEAKEVWSQYVALHQQDSLTPWERKARFAMIKSKFYDYVINVPIPYGELRINFDSEKEFGFYVSKISHPSGFYSYSEIDKTLNTGYNTKESIFI